MLLPTVASDRRAAFTLVEVMSATTLLGMAAGMTMVVFLATMKRAQHTELMLKGTSELRYAADVISQAVRSAPQLPTTANGGLRLFVPPRDTGYLIVEDGTWIDTAHTAKGWKSNQRTLQVSPVLSAAVNNVFAGSSRPAGVLSASDVATYFFTAATGDPPKVSAVVQSGDTVNIPATAFGAAVPSLTINSVSNNAGTATMTFTTNLGQDVPDGAIVSIASGRTLLFEIVATTTATATKGDLRHYPDSRDLTKFTLLAHDIDVAPFTDPSNLTGGRTVPFTINPSAPNCVLIDLQKVPAGSAVGRTLQGVISAAYTRTNPATE